MGQQYKVVFENFRDVHLRYHWVTARSAKDAIAEAMTSLDGVVPPSRHLQGMVIRLKVKESQSWNFRFTGDRGDLYLEPL